MTDSDDEDNDLLVDWKGTGGGSSFVQQKLPFKQVKARGVFNKASSAKVTLTRDVIVPAPDVIKSVPATTPEAVKPVLDARTRPIVVVSLSDSDAVKKPHRLNPLCS